MLKICAKNDQDATWVLRTEPILCFLLTFRLLDIGRMLLLRSMLTNFLPISPILTSSLTPFTFSLLLISSSEWSSGTRGLQIFSVVWNKKKIFLFGEQKKYFHFIRALLASFTTARTRPSLKKKETQLQTCSNFDNITSLILMKRLDQNFLGLCIDF